MTKQGKIREGIFKVLFPYSNADHYTGDGTVQKVLDYLHSQGVVIKVDEPVYSADVLVTCWRVEPLIEENKGGKDAKNKNTVG